MPDVALNPNETQQRVAEALAESRFRTTFGDIEVTGEMQWNSNLVAVERLRFGPNAKLLFRENVVRANPNIFIFAKEIISTDQQNPGTISWSDPGPSTPTNPGNGLAGIDNAAHQHIPGGAGGVGPTGIGGENGQSAPSLTIVCRNFLGGLKVLLPGENGGPGGQGGTGGAGGQGGRGRPASQGPFDCKRGAGDGQSGGNGGNGGNGGRGGNGGNGGTLTFVSGKDELPAFTRMLTVDLSGGQPGAGGRGGAGGLGGAGGPGAQKELPYCRDNGSDGPTGAQGVNGISGTPGNRGNSGQFFVGGLAVDQLDRVIG
jgi:hypothetical protein